MENLPAVAVVPPPLPAEQSPAHRLLAAWVGGRAPTTVRAYRSDLAHFAAWLGLPDATAAAAHLTGLPHGEANAVALNYRSALVEAGLSSATINRRLAALRSLADLAQTIGLIPWSLKIRGVKHEPRRDSRGPGSKGVRKLLLMAQAHDNGPDNVRAARNVAILRLLYDLGLRRAEVCRLNLGDLDRDGQRISVQGKGKREKIGLPMAPKTFDALASWLHARPSAAGSNPEAPLFVNLDRAQPCARLTGSGLYLIVRNLGEKAGIRARPHGLRHAGISAALDAANGDVREVRKFSRHADLNTVLVYDDSDDDTVLSLTKKVSEKA